MPNEATTLPVKTPPSGVNQVASVPNLTMRSRSSAIGSEIGVTALRKSFCASKESSLLTVSSRLRIQG